LLLMAYSIAQRVELLVKIGMAIIAFGMFVEYMIGEWRYKESNHDTLH